jgi:hypothetical protein
VTAGKSGARVELKERWFETVVYFIWRLETAVPWPIKTPVDRVRREVFAARAGRASSFE